MHEYQLYKKKQLAHSLKKRSLTDNKEVLTKGQGHVERL